MIVNVRARRAGVPFNFEGVYVASLDDLLSRYKAAGMDIDGYTIISNDPATIPNIPSVTGPNTPAPTNTSNAVMQSKGAWFIGGLIVVWLFWR